MTNEAANWVLLRQEEVPLGHSGEKRIIQLWWMRPDGADLPGPDATFRVDTRRGDTIFLTFTWRTVAKARESYARLVRAHREDLGWYHSMDSEPEIGGSIEIMGQLCTDWWDLMLRGFSAQEKARAEGLG